MNSMKMRIDTIWEELEKDKSFQAGLLYKRYSPEVDPDVFVALKAPEKLRCITFLVSSSSKIDLNPLNEFREIKFELMDDAKDQNQKFFLILLLDSQHKDIFSVLCQDLIQKVSNIREENILMNTIIERLIKWQTLFEKMKSLGLSDYSQRGLFGELYFLKKYLLNSCDYKKCINSWVGPEGSVQDFQYSDWAVEVKTTHGKNHQKIHVSNERQLDNSIVPNIFLFHLSIDIRQEYGETLNSIIQNIFEIISTNIGATDIFKLKLLEAGYFDRHYTLYNRTGYQIRNQNIYTVVGDFPRITEKQIPKGVGDVKYSIILSESESWRISESELFNNFLKANRND